MQTYTGYPVIKGITEKKMIRHKKISKKMKNKVSVYEALVSRKTILKICH